MAGQGQRRAVSQEIIGAVFRILFPGSAERIQGIQDVVHAIGSLDPQSVEGRALGRRLEDAADQIAARLDRIEAAEIPNLDEGERALAIEGVNKALRESLPPRRNFVRDAISTESLRRILEPVAERSWAATRLGDPALRYGRLYLCEAAAYVSSLVHDLPGFDSEVIWETYIRAKKIDEMLDRGITSVVLPRYRPGATQEVVQFETGYRSDMVSTYKDVDLFGLNLPVELRRHPVDVTYIRLRAGRPIDAASRPAGAGESAASPKVDHAIGALAAAAQKRSAGLRLLLTGAAGSGKTTITQWLAVTVAQRRLPSEMIALADCIPFVTQLRYAFKDGREPDYEDMILAAAYRGTFLPGSWIPDCLDDGRAVAIFDGYDELSEHDRRRAAIWVEKLMRVHPRSHFIVTSRPDNLDYRWFQRQGFERLELQPMNPAEALECSNRWFVALTSATTEHDRLSRYEFRHAQLLFDLRNRPTVRDLAETPLLCAMLCAFYAHELSEAAPQSRIELYERVVNALIHFRDYERTVDERLEEPLLVREKFLLLQAIARHMTVTSTTTIRTEPLSALLDEDIADFGEAHDEMHATTALDIVAAQLNGMVTAKVDPHTALAHLLARSVVLRPISNSHAQFAHRSIQEFLAGGAYGFGDVAELVPHAVQPDWRRVIIFAAGAARNEAATSRLVSGILDLADEYTEIRRDLLLLTAECLAAAGRVEDDVASRANRVIGEILPPRSRVEAASLSGLGEELLVWLDGHHEESPDVIASCIFAASRVGGPAAMRTIARYATTPQGPAVIQEILDAWDRFETEAEAGTYARDVLSRLALADHTLVIRTKVALSAVEHVRQARRIRIEVDEGAEDLRFLSKLPDLEEIDCRGLPRLRSVEGLRGRTALRRLNLTGKEDLVDLGAIATCTGLSELYLSGCRSLPQSEVGHLRNLVSLRALALDGCSLITDLSWIAGHPSLRTLSLNNRAVTSLDFCGSLPELRSLWAKSPRGTGDTRGVSSCAKLRRLSITLAKQPREPLALLPAEVRTVELRGHVHAADLLALRQCGNLRELTATNVVDLEDLDFLSDRGSLRSLAVTDCVRLGSCDALRRCASLEILDLSRSRISDLDFVEGMRGLRRIHLGGCNRLIDITMLAGLPMLEYVGISQVPGVSEEMVEDIMARSGNRLVVEHDPFADPFDISEYIGA
jgi:Leucine-rich repeat (LRR) protein